MSSSVQQLIEAPGRQGGISRPLPILQSVSAGASSCHFERAVTSDPARPHNGWRTLRMIRTSSSAVFQIRAAAGTCRCTYLVRCTQVTSRTGRNHVIGVSRHKFWRVRGKYRSVCEGKRYTRFFCCFFDHAAEISLKGQRVFCSLRGALAEGKLVVFALMARPWFTLFPHPIPYLIQFMISVPLAMVWCVCVCACVLGVTCLWSGVRVCLCVRACQTVSEFKSRRWTFYRTETVRPANPSVFGGISSA